MQFTTITRIGIVMASWQLMGILAESHILQSGYNSDRGLSCGDDFFEFHLNELQSLRDMPDCCTGIEQMRYVHVYMCEGTQNCTCIIFLFKGTGSS